MKMLEVDDVGEISMGFSLARCRNIASEWLEIPSDSKVQ